MAKTYNTLTIEVKEDITDIITAKQGDTNSRFLDVYLKDNGRPINLTGNEVKLYGKKQDGKVIFNNGQITDAINGRCQFELTSQALAVVGELQLEISIWQNNERTLTTQTFKVFVVPKIRNDTAIESSNEFGALVVLFQKLYDFWLDIEKTLGKPNDIGGTETTGTVMAKLNKLLTDWTSTRAGYLDLLNRGVSIKNIQRGFFFVNIKNGVPVEDEYRITLSTIVPSKTFILASGKMFSASGTISEDRIDTIGTTYFIYLPGLAGTASGSYGVRWQAIEFY